MLITRFLAPVLASCALATFASGCIIESGGDDATLEIFNDSDYIIDEVYLTDTGSSTWGPNLVRDSLLPGESVLLGVSCDYYDGLLVDEDGTECEVRDLDLCLNDAVWVIRNNTCNVFGAKIAEKTNDVTTATENATAESAK